MNFKRIIVWFRNDLRTQDQEALFKACQTGAEVIPVYCFDPRHFEPTVLGFPKTDKFRAKFLLESISDLRKNFKELGGNLVLLRGKPEVEVVTLAERIAADAIFFSEEVTAEERNVDKSLEKAAWAKGIATESFWQSTLYHIDDLPFPVAQIPEVFTQFRKSVEKMASVRSTFPQPTSINFPTKDLIPLEVTLPDLTTYGLEEPEAEQRSVMQFEGGESAGLRRIQTYFWEEDRLKVYKETRNGLIGADYSSKFSAWLSLGCISPRTIYEEVKRYERERKKNQSTYWLVFELIWRDYFRFICKKHGSQVFHIGGIKHQEDSWRRDRVDFQRWCEGQTGVPFVDANMRELKNSGFMSNRGRQNVASFLVNDLGIDWTWGASYFESILVDYDVCSNWGNWMYVGGVGNDPRENRYFNILRQGKNYDKNGDYVRLWIPELAMIQGFDIHQPWDLSMSELQKLGIELDKTYPQAMIEMESN
ncbi:DASH family cryptochrome [Algoriphagus sp. CAU 1675]|uniref:DASH family cryptochrome n=1 Tax=Algoriphagus sp. CAU 1675 TaxID=3032597 RepID=UPI0023DA78E9|nr:DASH family cryptochrome [Algoriphagus sp. CAU 1675]MDF2156382.1 DASH family cryptochrome [Algoriphagus sp. CAU 1675]